MIKQTYKSKNRIKTTEKQTSPSVKPEPKPLAVSSVRKIVMFLAGLFTPAADGS
jgi:hypothetical protein